MSEWISVQDQMPDNARDVLILLGNALVERGYWYHVGAKIDGWYFRGDRISNVTHWMPLPEPPMQQQANEKESDR